MTILFIPTTWCRNAMTVNIVEIMTLPDPIYSTMLLMIIIMIIIIIITDFITIIVKPL